MRALRIKTIIEPFRIKTVEPISLTTREQRGEFLKKAYCNLFYLQADEVIIDLLTDSGTAAMSADQWAAILRGDESYAGSRSFYVFEQAVRELMPFKHIIPTHQGRAAERILSSVLGGEGVRIPNNTHFDTTRANFMSTGCIPDNFPIAEGLQPSNLHPFKGNMDVEALKKYLSTHGDSVPIVMLTITNNAGGGQPVSMENIRAVKQVCEAFNKPLFLDACRFAENAYFIKQREPGFENKSIKEIVQQIFSYADGMTMSAKKDPFGNIGGWLALNDDELAEKCRNQLIITEGFATYGGLAGRDLEALAVGIKEAIDENYLTYRTRTIEYLGNALTKLNIPVIQPVGGHAVFIDAKAYLPHIPALQYPGQSLAVALYEIGGIRSCEIGSVMFADTDAAGNEKAAPMELVRLAFPRRVYTQSHVDYVIECFEILNQIKDQLPGYRIIWQPKMLRHFTAKFEAIC